MPSLKGLVKTVSSTVQERVDGYMNFFTGLGVALYDKAKSTTFRRKEQRSPEYWEDLFHENALARRIVMTPARDMVRKGFEITTDSKDFDSGALMQAWRNVPVSTLMPMVGMDAAFVYATALAKATGGSALVLGANDGTLDTALPLNLDTLQSLDWVKPLSRRALAPRTFYPSGHPKVGQVEVWSVSFPGAVSAYASVLVHETRMIMFDGEWCTDTRRAENQGWGESVYLALEESLQAVGTSFQAVATMLNDASQGMFKVKDLHHMVTGNDDGFGAIMKRLRLIDASRSYARAVALDADSESFEYAERTFTGIPQSIEMLMLWLSSETGIPVTKLFGRAPAGLNATGEADITNYYDEVGGQQVEYQKPRQRTALQVLMRAKTGPTKGAEPPNWDIAHKPLKQLSEKEQAELEKIVAEKDAIYLDKSVVLPEEIGMSRWGGGKFSATTEVDLSLREPGSDGDDPEAEGGGIGTGGGADNVQQTVLNGAQVTSLVDVVKAVAAEELPRDSGIAIIMLAFGLPKTGDDESPGAEEVLGEAGKSFKVEKPEPPMLGALPGQPLPKPKKKPGAADVEEQGSDE